MNWRRTAIALVIAAALLGAIAPFLKVDFLRPRIQDAIQRALNRQVEVGKVRFDLFTGPGFTLKDVTIYDDPGIGIEPFAYMETVHARVRLLSLFSGRLSFSNLRLVEPSVNLVKRDDGVWNFQLLLNRTGSPKDPPVRDFPSIDIRSGRINFKFGDTKSTFYLSEADVDLDPAPDRLDFRFRGEPARTDRSAQNFGELLFRGSWTRKPGAESELDVNAELDRSAINDAVKLIEGHGIGLHGIIASRAHISGPISQLAVTGQVHLEDLHRWDLMPTRASEWNLSYRGALDLWNQRIQLETVPSDTPSLPLLIRFEASQYLSKPHWAVTTDFRDVPSSTLLELARHMGAPLPDAVVADGKVAGVVGYSGASGFQGRVRFEDTSLKLPSADPIRFQSADIVIDNTRIVVGPATLQLPADQTAELEGSYLLDSADFQMKISTAAMDIAELHTGSGKVLGAGSLPVLHQCRQGSWKGWVAYSRTADEPGIWAADAQIQGARLEVPGIASPLRIASAALSLNGDRVALTKVRGTAGPVPFSAEFHSPRRLRIEIAQASIDQIEDIFLPSLQRKQSLLSRTFRFGRTAAPEWLRTRRLDATLKIDRLTIEGDDWAVNKARLVWNGPSVRLNGIDAHSADSAAMGALQIDLSGPVPVYSGQGRIENADYKGGVLTVDGSVEAEGIGADVLASAHGEGTFSGEAITFAPDTAFESIAGVFALSPGVRVKLTNVQTAQGAENYTGQGSTQPDGRLLLELTNPRKQLRLVGSLLTPAPPAVVR